MLSDPTALPAPQVTLGGVLGTALQANRTGRLHHFISGAHSPAIALFAREVTQANFEGDWYGEHAGKWLVAASKAAARDGDATLAAHVRQVADFLVQQQRSDGYLGTYAPPRRFMVPQPLKAQPGTWDGAPSVRTWDIWTHSYLILGLLDVHQQLVAAAGSPYLTAARRIGDLCWATLIRGDISITELGNHHGMSATVLLDPAMDLYFITREPRYLQLARLIVAQANADPALALVPRALAGADAADIATGKAYQLAWNLVGLAKLHQADPDAAPREVLDRLWTSIRSHHLSLGGGPWGGVAHRSREVFNAPGSFEPQAYVETCSILAWLQLNRELLAITGAPQYADEIERSAYNDLLGAMAPNGQDWCYYSFPNGKRVFTTYWRCCKSSGALAVEELPALAYGLSVDGTLSVHLYGPNEMSALHPQAGRLRLAQRTDYPFDGAIALRLALERPARFALRLRMPAWAEGATWRVNDGAATPAAPGQYAHIDRHWQDGDCITLMLPMAPVLHQRSKHNIQESRAPDGTPVQQDVLHHDYIAITRGPLVYATGLIDGFKTEETVRLPPGPSTEWLQTAATTAGTAADTGTGAAAPTADGEGPAIQLLPASRSPLTFVPYYRAGGRADGAWRLTWLSLAPSTNKP